MSSENCTGPIFLVGCPRSGNTLLGCILNKHPELVIFFENHTFYSLRRFWRQRSRSDGVSAVEALIDQFFEGKGTWIEKHTSLDFDRAELIEGVRARTDSSSWSDLLDAFMRLLGERVKPSFQCWGDKTPRNIGELAAIGECYPEAQIVFIYRDPRDVVTSLSDPDFHHASDDPLMCAELVRRYWRVYEEQKKSLDSDRLHELRYESLVGTPESTLRELCEFLDIEFVEAMLEAGDREVRNRIGWSDYKGWEAIRPQESSKRKAGSEWVEALFSERLDELGYRRMYADDSAKRSLAEIYTARFRVISRGLEMLWRQRYPEAGHLMIHELPTLRDYLRWASQSMASTLPTGKNRF